MLNMHRIVKEITHIEKLGIKRPLKRLDTQRSANKKCYASECFHQIKMMTFGIRSSRSSSVLFYSVFRAKPARHGFRPSVVTLGNATQVCVPHPTPNPSRTFGCSRFFFFLILFYPFLLLLSFRPDYYLLLLLRFYLWWCCVNAVGYRYSISIFHFILSRLDSQSSEIEVTIYILQQHRILVTHTHTQHKRTQIVDAKARSKSCVRSNE